MMLKIIPVLLISFAVSACGLIGGEKETTPTVSAPPQVVKTSLKSESTPAATTSTAAKCDDKGFCPLPGLKKPKKTD